MRQRMSEAKAKGTPLGKAATLDLLAADRSGNQDLELLSVAIPTMPRKPRAYLPTAELACMQWTTGAGCFSMHSKCGRVTVYDLTQRATLRQIRPSTAIPIVPLAI